MTHRPISISDAARTLGTTERALRYYEQRGLLSPGAVTAAGHRRYDVEALRRARYLLALRSLGLTLATIENILDPHTSTDLAAVLVTQSQKLDKEISDLLALRARLDKITAAVLNPELTDELLDTMEKIAMKIVLNRIYTRTGDDGTTALAGAVRVEKADPRVEAMGDVDELVSAIGLAIASTDEHGELLLSIQNDLFDLGADLASVFGGPAGGAPMVGPEYIERLEQQCDRINAELAPPTSFVLPGNNIASAALHHARAVCRRAERHAWAVPETAEDDCRYLNRLADLLFILARSTESEAEPTWVPRSHQPASA